MTALATIGAYTVLEKLGEGGMGTVYLGEHTLLGRKAAIKVLLPSLSADQSVVRRFFNEARAVTQISDPGIVQVFDFGYHTDGSAFIVMELLDGESMTTRLRRIKRFSAVDCVRLMRMICTSLGAAHAKGIIHRDLKPDNIFIVGDPAVTGGERPKILDFGIAKLSGDIPDVHKTRPGMLMGTPIYMSPEQCRAAGEVDHRADIYSIACVMFKLLTGRAPFKGAGSGELIAAHLREPPPFAAALVPELPETIDLILQRCLRKNPAERYQSMTELAAALGQAEDMLHHASQPTIAFEAPRLLALTPAPTQAAMTQASTPTPVGATLVQDRAAVAPAPASVHVVGASIPGRTARPRNRSSWPVIVGAAVVTVAIMVVATIYARHRRRALGPSEAPATVSPGTASPAPLPAAPSDAAAPAAATVMTRDAGIPDGSVAALRAPVDAGMIERPRDVGAKPGRRPTATKPGHASSTGSNAPVVIDRGD